LRSLVWLLYDGTCELRLAAISLLRATRNTAENLVVDTLTIRGRALGRRRPLFADWSIPFPPEWFGAGGLTLRDLIGRVVRSEVQAFQQRQADRQVFHALTARQIEAGVEKGKIEMGGSEVPRQPVDEAQAVAVACQAFEDGMFIIAIDEQEHRELDREIHVRPNSRITFVRLTLLAGG
jgi:hypothetical protein